MSSIAEKVVIITGASSGIGEAVAKRLAAKGARVMLAARREDRLKKTVDALKKEGHTVEYCVTDVTRLDQVQALAEAAKKAFGRIDVLINNAGIMPISRMIDMKIDEWEKMVDVNIKGVLYGIAAVLPGMMEQKSGHIINISSVAGHKVMQASAVYSGTKFAVRAITDGLRQEVGSAVRTTIICPGAVKTELPNTISNPTVQQMVQGLYDAQAIDPSAIARAIEFSIEQPADVDVNEIIVRPTVQEF